MNLKNFKQKNKKEKKKISTAIENKKIFLKQKKSDT